MPRLALQTPTRSTFVLTLLLAFSMIAAACGIGAAAPPPPSTTPASLPASLLDTVEGELGSDVATGGPQQDPGRPLWSSFEEAEECMFTIPEGTEPECGWLVAPQLRRSSGPSRAEVRLPVAIFRATGSNPEPDPVIYLHGGPGAGALTYFSYLSDKILGPFNEDRDVIVFDQRGAGMSEPSLECRWYTLGSAGTDIGDDATLQTAAINVMDECADDLTLAGIDLTAYNSLSNAADIEDLRRVLEYDQVNLYGVSYGTRLAQTVMREFPWAVRSAILDSAYPTNVDLTLSMPENFEAAMNRVVTNCENEAPCAAAYPDLRGALDRVSTRSQDSPLIVNGVPARPAVLALVLFGMLYRKDSTALIPGFITELDNGSTGLLGSYLLTSDLLFLGGVGPFTTVMCAEEVPFSSPNFIEESRTGVPLFDAVDVFPDGRGPAAFAACDAWRAFPVDPIENELFEIYAPTLVLGGEYDPITPTRWGQALAEPWDTVSYLQADGEGHGVVGNPCIAERVIGFMVEPEASVDTTTCPAEGPLFATPSTWTQARDVAGY